MQLISVSSSNVSQVGYENGVLEVHFHSGGVYQYFHVPEEVFRLFLSAPSKGKFVHRHLKGKFPFTRLR